MRHIEGPSSEHAALSASLEKAVFWQAPWTRTENPQGGERNVVVHNVWKRTFTGQMFLYLCYLATGTILRCIQATWYPG